jgi:hypothetical protein
VGIPVEGLVESEYLRAMTTVIVEREFPDAVNDEALMTMKEATERCIALNDVKLTNIWGSTDRKRFICVLEGPDTEAVRRAIDSTEIPYERLYAVNVLL